jgi:hypothetical protein
VHRRIYLNWTLSWSDQQTGTITLVRYTWAASTTQMRACLSDMMRQWVRRGTVCVLGRERCTTYYSCQDRLSTANVASPQLPTDEADMGVVLLLLEMRQVATGMQSKETTPPAYSSCRVPCDYADIKRPHSVSVTLRNSTAPCGECGFYTVKSFLT